MACGEFGSPVPTNVVFIKNLRDVPGFRTILGELMPDAPAQFRSPILKTTALLFAYGVQFKIRFPTDVADRIHSDASSATLVPELLRDLVLSASGDTNEMQTAEPRNDAYPILLGAIADIC